VFLESAHDDDRELPVARGEVTWIDCKNDAADHFGWVACDNRTTRAVAKIFREDYRIRRKAVKAQAYWAA
jgi:NADPH-dependent ferric siderophore reductase